MGRIRVGHRLAEDPLLYLRRMQLVTGPLAKWIVSLAAGDPEIDLRERQAQPERPGDEGVTVAAPVPVSQRLR